MEATNTGLSGEEQDRQSPAGPDTSNPSPTTISTPVTSSTSTTVRPHSASPLAASSPASPEQKSNTSVRELETAMSKHLPAETSPASLLKHFYSRPGGYPEPSWLPGSAYPGVPGPAQPLAIKPYGGVESSAYPGLEQNMNIYSHSASLHLYNRGQTWYSGN